MRKCKMLSTVHFAAMTLCLAFAASVVQTADPNTWPKIQLPHMRAETIVSVPAEGTENVGSELRVGVDGERFDVAAIEHSLSFQQTSARNLSNTQRTRVTFEDAENLFRTPEFRGAAGTESHSAKPRSKRHIFGPDNRSKITEDFQRIFPFSAVAQLSTGCSGILIGPRQVLTAAECIHNGRRYRGNAKNLQVGLTKTGNHTRRRTSSQNEVLSGRDLHGLEWYDVEQLYLPDGWLTPSYGEQQESFNYAVLELAEEHNHNCMEVGVSSMQNTNRMQRIHFSSFDDYNHHPDPALTYRYCYIVADSTKYLYEKCDSTKSSVGAGIYLRLWDSDQMHWSRRVMAVKTSHTERMRIKGKRQRAGRDVRLTLLNFGQICYWVMRDFEACSRGRIKDACLMA
ncbi:serine protease 23-like [Diadema antillarum]|uniref:serine protease 23-like n=1 Tax=Diadema antillarum TaxID=105358 RepID=UPI003A8997C4